MKDKRVIVIGLDGFELSIAEKLMTAGKMPNFARMREAGTSYLLDHGSARETGLAWEHFSNGQDPDTYERWSAVEFDPSTYTARQAPTRARPFLAEVDHPIVSFDVPYLDIGATASVQGMANWGAHDPGVVQQSNPPNLVDEIDRRFGPYPAKPYIYGFVWPSPDKSEEMATLMIESVRKRTEVTSWLLKERLPDWTLAITVISELHSVAEAMWHGIDAEHPLHRHPSSAAAKRAIEGVYEEMDRLIERLQAEHPDATLVAFAMHGMGPNVADIPSMVLLPEFLYQKQFGRAHFHPRKDWDPAKPMLQPGEEWSSAINAQLAILDPRTDDSGLLGRFIRKSNRMFDRLGHRTPPASLPWMPAARYAPFWPKMETFALPSFYDGQIRVNLKGREKGGLVPLERYSNVLDDLEETLGSARDATTSEALVASFERPLQQDPFVNSETRCDLKIAWKRNTCAMDVPGHPIVGPVPQRRTGGHTGDHGYALILGADGQLSDEPVANSFDIVPTILAMIGLEAPAGVAGRSLFSRATG